MYLNIKKVFHYKPHRLTKNLIKILLCVFKISTIENYIYNSLRNCTEVETFDNCCHNLGYSCECKKQGECANTPIEGWYHYNFDDNDKWCQKRYGDRPWCCKFEHFDRGDDDDTTTTTSCFPAGTLILMGDGSYKPIEDVVVGDFVLSFDFESGRNVAAEVLEIESPVRNHMCELLFSDGSKLLLTDEHPVYTIYGWKSIVPEHTELEVKLKNATPIVVSKLSVGDLALSIRFNPEAKEFENYLRTIISISCENKTIKTYNLNRINQTMTFYADNVLVHNKYCLGLFCGE